MQTDKQRFLSFRNFVRLATEEILSPGRLIHFDGRARLSSHILQVAQYPAPHFFPGGTLPVVRSLVRHVRGRSRQYRVRFCLP